METKELQNVTNEQTGTPEGKQKRGFFGWVKHVRDVVMANKVGRTVVRGTKILGGGAIIYGAYKKGQKSVKPTVVYIQNENPESTAEETAVEPAETEQTDE